MFIYSCMKLVKLILLIVFIYWFLYIVNRIVLSGYLLIFFFVFRDSILCFELCYILFLFIYVYLIVDKKLIRKVKILYIFDYN